jgi:hypothetical protein
MAFTTGQAGGQIQQVAVPTAYSGDAQELARSQRLAQLLSGQQMPEGQMVSGRFVAPSWTQHLAQLVNAGTGAYYADQAEKQNLALAKKIREGENVALADYMAELQGRPAVPEKVTEMAGPYGQGVGQAGANVPMPTATIAGRPAIQANPRVANLNAAQNDMLPSWMRQYAMKEATKGPDYKEIQKLNEKTGNTEIYRYDANSPDPTSTMQFLGIHKPAMSQAETIRLRDEGLLPAGNGNMSVGGGNAPTGGGAPMGGGGSPANPSAKPVLAKNDEAVKAFGYNPFEAPKPPPTLTSGPQIRKFYADQASPLPAESQKTVRGAINYQKAVEDLQSEFAGYSDLDLAKPNVRAKLQQKLTNAYLLGKEANTLGALTGPDMGLLEKLVTDPTAFSSLILDRKTINSLYDAQRRSAGDTIRESYRLDQKAVPEDLRSHIIVKPRELPMPKTDIKTVLKAQNIPYDPSYEYKVNPDGTVDRRKKR